MTAPGQIETENDVRGDGSFRQKRSKGGRPKTGVSETPVLDPDRKPPRMKEEAKERMLSREPSAKMAEGESREKAAEFTGFGHSTLDRAGRGPSRHIPWCRYGI
jgi:hypothetical protein